MPYTCHNARPPDQLAPVADELYEIERDLLLEAIYRRYGYDFRGYADLSLRRRIAEAVAVEGLGSISELQAHILRKADCLDRFVAALSLHVSALFREPGFYRAFRQEVVPFLRTYPSVRIWIAGCASGEDIYSVAIILREEAIYQRCRIYATDLSDVTLQRARQAAFPASAVDEYARNYAEAGGTGVLSSYYAVEEDRAVFHRSLTENVTFAQHNLVCDGSFNEFNVVLCRNVMLYYTPALQERVLGLIDLSLCRFGILGIGSRETINLRSFAASYEAFRGVPQLFRKIR